MPREPLRAALAACGGIAGLTLDAARRSPDFEVVAIQDVDGEALVEVGDRFGIRRRHLEFTDLLSRDVDFVIVNGPNHVHRPQVLQAVAAGKPCLVQKPMAPTLEEAEEMVQAAEEHGVPLGVTMFELGKPLHHQVKAMVASGWLGEPTLIQAVSAHDIYLRTPPPEDDWRRDPVKVGGGAFVQLAVHHLNLASWMLEREIEAVTVVGTRGRTVFEDETTLATALLVGGTAAHFAASYATSLYGFTVCGTRGRIHLLPEHVVVSGDEPCSGEIFDYTEPGRETVIPIAALREAIDRRADAVEVHGAFARRLRDGEAFPCTGRRGLRDMRVVDTAYRSLREGRTLRVP